MKKSKKTKKNKLRYAVMTVHNLSHVFKFDEPWLRAEAAKFYRHRFVSEDMAYSLVAEFPNRKWYDCINKKSHGFCIATDADIAARDEQAQIDSTKASERKEAARNALAAGALPFLLGSVMAPSRFDRNQKSLFMDEKGNQW